LLRRRFSLVLAFPQTATILIMKKILFFCLFVFFISDAFATHIIGGEMRYEYIGPGSLPNTKQYRCRLLLFRGPTGAGLATQYIVGVFNNDNGFKVTGTGPNSNWAANEDFSGVLSVPIIISPCIEFPPVLNYTYKTYSFVIDLPDNNNGYTVTFQTYSRQGSSNIQIDQGATYSCSIPGLNQIPNPQFDNSPVFSLPVSVICENSNFTLDYSAVDPDGDSLVYSFCNAYNGGAANSGAFDNPAPPPYGSVNYTIPYNAIRPMGNAVTINPNTGIISGISPAAGKYVVCVCISVYRNNVLISIQRKDLVVEVSGCIPLSANPDFNSVTCSGFTVTLTQSSTGNPDTYFWDFGDPLSGPLNFSTFANPVHTFTDTGVFNVKLVVTKSGVCSDSIIKPIGVYPEFFPGFINAAQLCVNTPIQFTDTSYFRYGNVIAWNWDFGDPLSGPLNTSGISNPLHTFATANTYPVKLVVTNNKGCIDSITKNIIINNNPLLSLLSADSTYCGLDSLSLNASGTGSFNWTPNTNIIGANTATPRVFPTVPTRYVATLTDGIGCFSKDSILVTPAFDLTNSMTASAINICEEDTIVLKGFTNKTNNIIWQWSPIGTVQSPAIDTTRAYPTVTTNYILTTRWGSNCVATANQNIVVKPLAIPDAGPDAALCNGQATIQLNASGGDTYQWTPTAGLSNPNIPNPVASPNTTTTYTVAVGVTGCSKTRADSMVLTVRTLPTISTTNDTLICFIDTLQINSTGTGNFVWTPNYMISNTTIANPLVSPDVPTTYYVRLTDNFGCYRDDSIYIDVRTSVSLNAGGDTTICQTDTIRLNPVSDGLYYQWTPSTYLDVANIKNPLATPLTDITYTVVSSIGKCSNTDNITFTVVPYPRPNAGADLTICSGFSTQLNASGGSSYAWSPATFLNNTLIPNPTSVNPTANIQYIVTVRDVLGCPKPVKDTVWVYVAPPVVANAGPSDTTVVLGQPLQLHATGGDSYDWSPPLWLNNPTIQNPIALPQDDITYRVTATTTLGCIGTDIINIKLYKVDPDLYVPKAFSPNGDGNNETLRPILLGMRDLHYFKVFNRIGQMVFSTSTKDHGWDGTFNGKAQDPGTYVWLAEGINYKGELRQKKGTSVLIR